MKVVMVWYGGINFDRPDEDGGEEFSSLSAAKARFANWLLVEEDTPDNGGPEGHIYFGSLKDWCPANGADRVLSFGPRGGVRID